MQKFTRDRLKSMGDTLLEGFRCQPAVQLLGLWAIAATIDRLWFMFDLRVPDWDRADYLTGTLNYWKAFQTPDWWSSEWWTQLWLLSSKIPPLTYISTVPIHHAFGTGFDRTTLVNLFFSGILLVSVYGLGRHLFSHRVGVWAAVLCLLFPGLIAVRLDFLLDYPLAAVTTLAFFTLTLWRNADDDRPHSWTFAVLWGLALGAGILLKQSIALFLTVPMLWVFGELTISRRWEKLLQFVVSFGVSALVWGWWYRANWLLVLTSSKRATIDSAIAEGDPPLNHLKAWTYYLEILPEQVSWLFLAVSISGLVKLLLTQKNRPSPHLPLSPSPSLKWLAVFLIGAYLLCSFNINKDWRYSLPYLPVLATVMAYGLTGWGWRVRWGTAIAATGLAVISLRPTTEFDPATTRAYRGQPFPHTDVIAEITRTDPYLQTTLGVLPSTPAVNQHNLNYYGALANFQVYGRQVGVRSRDVPQDVRSLSWFVTKTGDPGSVPDAYDDTVALVEDSGEFSLHRQFPLPDGERLNLYRRQSPFVTITATETPTLPQRLSLDSVMVPPRIPPGSAVPVTYQWSGSWARFTKGMVLVTWRKVGDRENSAFWLHDRAIASGFLMAQPHPGDSACQSDPHRCRFQVTERTAMYPPATLPPGTYALEARYLDLETGAIEAIAIPSLSISLDPAASPVEAPELDRATQFRELAAAFPQGTVEIDRVFAEIGRINQYDPVQGYLDRAIAALESRLERYPNRADWAYGVGLAWVLKKRADRAIPAFERVVELDGDNPYAYAYLAIVNLADWHPVAAQRAIDLALAIDPTISELQVLDGVAALMRGNLLRAYRVLSSL
ncbi:phospholipid carrier-dependent glycosyltransferase [Geitlerinema sp. CS-897]|nr:phospholipid carrier-dependent glycosyltransferase [Geitlerinema sp. CS-897]